MTNPFTKQANEALPTPGSEETKAADAVGDVLKQAAAAASGGITTGMTGAVAVGTQAPARKKRVTRPEEGYCTVHTSRLAGLEPTVTVAGVHYWDKAVVEADAKAKARAEALVAAGRATKLTKESDE